VKSQRKTISSEEKVDILSQLEEDERIVDICCNVRLIGSSVHTFNNNPDRFKASAQSGTKEFVSVEKLPQSYWNEPY
jgi:hypothetical protein